MVLHFAADLADFVRADLGVERSSLQKIQRRSGVIGGPGYRADAAAGVDALGQFRCLLNLRHFSKSLFAALRLVRAWLVGTDEAIVLGIVQADTNGPFGGEGLRHLTADAYSDRRVTTIATIIEIAAQPAVMFHSAGIGGGLPNFGGAEVGTIGIWIANALDDCQMAVAVKRFESFEGGMKPKLIVDLQYVLGGHSQARPRFGVIIVAEWHQGIQPVIAAGHLQNHQNVGIGAGSNLRGFIRRFGLPGRESVSQKGGDRPSEGATEDGGAEEVPPCFDR